MFRMCHAAIILFTSMLSALLLTANSVSAQTRTGDPPAVNGTMFLVAIIVAGIVELAIVAYWVFQIWRGRMGRRQWRSGSCCRSSPCCSSSSWMEA